MSKETTPRPADSGTYDKDSPRFTKAMMERSLRFDQLSPNVQKTLRELNESLHTDPKEEVALHLSKDVADRLRAAGDDWEAQVEEALRNWLEQNEMLRKAS